MLHMLKKIIAVWIMVSFGLSSVYVQAPAAQISPFSAQNNLPLVGSMVNITELYRPAIIRGLQLIPDQPFRFDFIVEPGQSGLDELTVKDEALKLIHYFYASLTVPEKNMWVNLSPFENNRIIPEEFGITEMGRDLLAQDYILKQLTSSLMYPEGETGKKLWTRIYDAAYAKYGTTDVPTDAFHKVWIVPNRAVVYAQDDQVYVVGSSLKVMLEEDYFVNGERGMVDNKTNPSTNHQSPPANDIQQIIRDIVIPVIEDEVNHGKNFAPLRQIYHSLILAQWFKTHLKESILGQVYVDQNKVSGIDLDDKSAKQAIYEKYLESFKAGVYDFIKEEYDPATQTVIPRKYFSGGLQMIVPLEVIDDYAMLEKTLLPDIDLAGPFGGTIEAMDRDATHQMNARMREMAEADRRNRLLVVTAEGKPEDSNGTIIEEAPIVQADMEEIAQEGQEEAAAESANKPSPSRLKPTVSRFSPKNQVLESVEETSTSTPWLQNQKPVWKALEFLSAFSLHLGALAHFYDGKWFYILPILTQALFTAAAFSFTSRALKYSLIGAVIGTIVFLGFLNFPLISYFFAYLGIRMLSSYKSGALKYPFIGIVVAAIVSLSIFYMPATILFGALIGSTLFTFYALGNTAGEVRGFWEDVKVGDDTALSVLPYESYFSLFSFQPGANIAPRPASIPPQPPAWKAKPGNQPFQYKTGDPQVKDILNSRRYRGLFSRKAKVNLEHVAVASALDHLIAAMEDYADRKVVTQLKIWRKIINRNKKGVTKKGIVLFNSRAVSEDEFVSAFIRKEGRGVSHLYILEDILRDSMGAFLNITSQQARQKAYQEGYREYLEYKKGKKALSLVKEHEILNIFVQAKLFSTYLNPSLMKILLLGALEATKTESAASTAEEIFSALDFQDDGLNEYLEEMEEVKRSKNFTKKNEEKLQAFAGAYFESLFSLKELADFLKAYPFQIVSFGRPTWDALHEKFQSLNMVYVNQGPVLRWLSPEEGWNLLLQNYYMEGAVPARIFQFNEGGLSDIAVIEFNSSPIRRYVFEAHQNPGLTEFLKQTGELDREDLAESLNAQEYKYLQRPEYMSEFDADLRLYGYNVYDIVRKRFLSPEEIDLYLRQSPEGTKVYRSDEQRVFILDTRKDPEPVLEASVSNGEEGDWESSVAPKKTPSIEKPAPIPTGKLNRELLMELRRSQRFKEFAGHITELVRIFHHPKLSKDNHLLYNKIQAFKNYINNVEFFDLSDPAFNPVERIFFNTFLVEKNSPVSLIRFKNLIPEVFTVEESMKGVLRTIKMDTELADQFVVLADNCKKVIDAINSDVPTVVNRQGHQVFNLKRLLGQAPGRERFAHSEIVQYVQRSLTYINDAVPDWDDLKSDGLEFQTFEFGSLESIESLLLKVVNHDLDKLRPLEFQRHEFSYEGISVLVRELGKSEDFFKDVNTNNLDMDRAVAWLNTNIEPFKIYIEHIKINKISKDIKNLLPLDFKTLSDDQLKQFALTDDGKRLKRAIIKELYQDQILTRIFEDKRSAVAWLNTSIEPFKVFIKDMKEGFSIEERTKNLLPPNFKKLSDDQLKEFALTDNGKRLKRAILKENDFSNGKAPGEKKRYMSSKTYRAIKSVPVLIQAIDTYRTESKILTPKEKAFLGRMVNGSLKYLEFDAKRLFLPRKTLSVLAQAIREKKSPQWIISELEKQRDVVRDDILGNVYLKSEEADNRYSDFVEVLRKTYKYVVKIASGNSRALKQNPVVEIKAVAVDEGSLTPVGGINFDPTKIHFEEQGAGVNALMNQNTQSLQQQIMGIRPVIINIQPISATQILSQLRETEGGYPPGESGEGDIRETAVLRERI